MGIKVMKLLIGVRIKQRGMQSVNFYYIIKHFSTPFFCFQFTTFITQPTKHSHIDLLKIALSSFHSYFQEFPVTLTFPTITFYHYINKSTFYFICQAPRSSLLYFLIEIISPLDLHSIHIQILFGHTFIMTFTMIFLHSLELKV